MQEVNNDQLRYFFNQIVENFGGKLDCRTLAFWGVAFKPDTDDIRDAPSLTLMREALAAGANVRAFDPVALPNLSKELAEVIAVSDMYDVLEGCDALVICTEWSEFRQPDFKRMLAALNEPVIFDGRNIYRREQMERLGFVYYSVGREPIGRPSAPSASESGRTQSSIKRR